jgi:hypothetical protein
VLTDKHDQSAANRSAKEKTMATDNESPIKEKDSYYVLWHRPTGRYVHDFDLDFGCYGLENTSLLEHYDILGSLRMYPRSEDRAMIALAAPPGTESEAPRSIDKEARTVIDQLNQDDKHFTGVDGEGDYEYSDFELRLIEVEYTVKDVQLVAEVVAA